MPSFAEHPIWTAALLLLLPFALALTAALVVTRNEPPIARAVQVALASVLALAAEALLLVTLLQLGYVISLFFAPWFSATVARGCIAYLQLRERWQHDVELRRPRGVGLTPPPGDPE